jgi:hypothetical protein
VKTHCFTRYQRRRQRFGVLGGWVMKALMKEFAAADVGLKLPVSLLRRHRIIRDRDPGGRRIVLPQEKKDFRTLKTGSFHLPDNQNSNRDFRRTYSERRGFSL